MLAFIFKRLLSLPFIVVLALLGNAWLQQSVHVPPTSSYSPLNETDELWQNAHTGALPLAASYTLLTQPLAFFASESLSQNLSVGTAILNAAPTSITLGLTAFFLLYLAAIGHSYLCLITPTRSIITLLNQALLFLSIIPSSLLGLTLATLFASRYGFVLFPLKHLSNFSLNPATYTNMLWHLVLPLCTIILPRLFPLSHFIQQAYWQEYHKPYAKTQRVLGLDEHVILSTHIMPNLTLSILTTVPRTFLKLLFSSTMITEIIFSLNGLGSLAYQAAQIQDTPLMLALTLIGVCTSSLCYLCVDLLFYYLDPRLSV